MENAKNRINIFRDLLQIDVSKHVEKKGQFSYLSWPYAVSQLRLADPQATWEVKRTHGLPYLQTDLGYFVEVAVTVQGITLSQIHPVLDARNRPIPSPTTFDINTSIQRCLVKAIALHGLGLNIYAGEDLPIEQREPTAPPQPTRNKVSPLPPREEVPAFGTSGEKLITPAQIINIRRLIAETRTDENRLLDYFGLASLDTIPQEEVSRVIKALDSKRRAA
jgi:hypothetical protein